MEMIKVIRSYKKLACVCIAALFFLCTSIPTSAQVYTIKDGRIYIEMKKQIEEKALDSFIVRFDLADLALKYFIISNSTDSLKKMGWHFEFNNKEMFGISKPLVSSEDLTNVADKIMFTTKEPGNDVLFPAVNNGMVFGYNQFKNKLPFAIRDSMVTFFLRENKNANRVMLAGSFNNWDPDALPMIKTDSGWIAYVKLGPGKYWYKFIINGNWSTDDDNFQQENDGRGNTNSIFYKPNYVFTLDTFKNAKHIYLAGNFNNWRPKELLMQPTATGWKLPVYLADGTYIYKYVVDGEWKTDPTNPDHLPNEFNAFNSMIKLGKPTIFKLNGYQTANTVLLTGSFNDWKKYELYMQKTETGWELPYALGPGNYEYRFIVDGKQIPDPENPITINNGGKQNSYLILDPNYTFRLKGHADAKTVYLGGDFNDFSTNSLAMKKVGDEWVFSVHLSRGKHIYKFVVDGKWMKDPDNTQWEQNKYGTGDSVIWVEQ